MRTGTRSTAAGVIKHGDKMADSTIPSRDLQQHQPVKILIAPKSISQDARILTLKNPCDGIEKRFLFCPQQGLYELRSMSAAPTDYKSILFSSNEEKSYDENTHHDTRNSAENGYVNKEARFLVATPFDITFVLLRILAPAVTTNQRTMFQPLDDLMEIPKSEEAHLRYMLEAAPDLIEAATSNICDTVEASDEKMFRYSEKKVLNLCLQRAQQILAKGLPTSLEERFVSRQLEAPVLSVKRTDVDCTPSTLATEPTTEGITSLESDSSTVSNTSNVFSQESQASTTASTIEHEATPDVHSLLRLRVALNFILATTVPSHVSTKLQISLAADDSPVSFVALDKELERLAILRAEALASRSLSDFSRKRSHADDEEAAELRADKKRKQEEEEKKRKANESRGVRDLKKVNVSGMKKMSAFFAKKPATAAKAKA